MSATLEPEGKPKPRAALWKRLAPWAITTRLLRLPLHLASGEPHSAMTRR